MTDLRYNLCFVLGFVLALSFQETQAGNFVPVLLWGSDLSLPKFVSPFERTSQDEFEKILEDVVGGTNRPVVVFLKDNCCVDDLSQHAENLTDINGDGSSVRYLPSVDSPLSVFQNFPMYNHTTEEKVESVSDGQVAIIEEESLNDIPEMYKRVKDLSPGLVGFVFGKSCKRSVVERSRRAAEESTASNMTGFGVNTTRILLYASSEPTLMISDEKDAINELNPNPTQEGDGTEASPLQLNFEYSIKNTTNPRKVNVILQFPVKTAGYYYTQLLYKDGESNRTLLPETDFVFPYNFSYHCSQNVRFGNASLIAFDITDFQVQIDSKNFYDAYDCVGFTSIPIWSGIFVTALFALITIWGLTMIMDIRTMDRFDDPKGKTITISGAE